ncbi:Aste57867_1195 [Aphanomyces stellatus]|uniref:Aste57867_1195 protein n=1 Tax=Aphanomyces stellatus TaxID=120398 RepID=A0A485K4K8_9STRA|nr:hypothetical protein As57867_001194 [Aphanomyces stellatus]VFT78415.1 Aste57867_1195 [Aphanomyces stellatus]
MLDVFTWCQPQTSPTAGHGKIDSHGRETQRLRRNQNAAALEVEVIGHTVSSQGNDKFTVYIILVSFDGVKSTVLRRYRQFFELNAQLSHHLGCAKAFPERVLFNNRSTELIHRRQIGLNASVTYLKALLADMDARDSHLFRTFLGVPTMTHDNSRYIGFEWSHRSGRF